VFRIVAVLFQAVCPACFHPVSQALRRDLDGGCRTDAWDLVAQVLEGRAGAHLAAGRLPQALALRLLVLQVRRAAS